MQRDTPFPRDTALTRSTTVRAAIDALAEIRGGATFLVNPETGHACTFAQVRSQSLRIAGRLADMGLRRGDTVATLLRSGLPSAQLMLGALYVGFIPVPLNPGAGELHLAYALTDCGTGVVFVGDDYQELAKQALPAVRRPVRLAPIDQALDADPAADAKGAAEPTPLPAIEENDAALLIYTSDSTGAPKGALFTHGQLLACARNTIVSHALTADDRLFCVLPLYHMNAVDKLLGVLLSGGAIVLPQRFTVATFWRHVAEHRCTWLALVPTIIAQLLAWSDQSADARAAALRHVRFVRCSSAPLSENDHRAFEDRFGLVVVQGLGMTEAGGIFLNPVPPRPRKIGSVGLSYGFEVKVADAQRREVAAGDTGEIIVRGPSVMQGYHRNAAATAEVLDGDGWLRTGDCGYHDGDGYFFIVGRSKELSIKGGTNIAPQEIDHALAAHPAILEAAAVGLPDRYLGEDIVAYTVLKPGARVTPQDLRDFCANQIGEFKTPTQIYFVDALPKGPSGKVQRLRLRPPAAGAAAHAPESDGASGELPAEVPPRTPIEELLADLWKEALGLDAVSVHANFFAVGGYCLLALEILARLRRHRAIEVPLRIFFEAPTIAAQARTITQQLVSDDATVAAHLRDVASLSRAERVALEEAQLLRARSARSAPRTPSASAVILLAPVQLTGSQPPVFCIYGVTPHLDLAKLLGSAQPTYAVLPGREVDVLSGDWGPGQRPPLPTVEELAAIYLEQIRTVQSVGPYRLVGHSFGGRLAFEITQQLLRGGDPVALLAALDTFMPGAVRWLPLRWLVYHVNQGLRRGPAYTLGAARRRAARTSQREPHFRRVARAAHVPSPYHGRVLLLRATAGRWPGYRFDPHLGWDGLAGGGLTIHDIPGDHDGMLKNPNVQVVADTLRNYLSR